MDAHAAHHGDVVGDRHMPGQHHVVGDDALAADVGVVADVGVDHEQVLAAHAGDSAAGFGADVDGHGFSDDVAVADFQFHRPASIFQILRRSTNDAERVEDVVPAHGRVAFHHDVAEQLAPWPDDDVGPNDAERPDLHVIR